MPSTDASFQEPDSPSPVEIGHQFVSAYYQKLIESPESTHEFYHSESGFARLSSTGPSDNVVGRDSIKAKIAELGHQNSKVALDSVDCQEGANGGIMVLVTGFFLNATKTPRAFCQTFYLTQDDNMRYYVRNDVLRYLSPYISPPNVGAASEAPAPTPAPTPAPAAKPSPKKAPLISNEVLPPVKLVPAPTPVVKEPAQVAPVVEEPVVEPVTDSREVEEPVQEATPAPAKEAKEAIKGKKERKSSQKGKGKKEDRKDNGGKADKKDSKPSAPAPATAPLPNTWAARFFGVGAPQASFQDPLPGKEDNKAAPNGTPEQADDAPRAKAAPRVQKERSEEAGDSLYVSNLPGPVEMADIERLFAGYGTIKNVDLPAKKSFCFVSFANAESVEKALKGGSIMLDGHELGVSKKRQPFPRSNDRSRGRGRGGSRDNAGRGRGRGGDRREQRGRGAPRGPRTAN